jgi:ABC-type Fe3+-siderophore transport system permease subunit
MDYRAPVNGPPKGFSALAYVGIIVGVFLAIVKALVWSKGAFTSEVFGYAVAGALLPGAIAYAIAGRKKVRNPNKFALCFVALCVFFLLLEVANR